jgi:hypothetical protein
VPVLLRLPENTIMPKHYSMKTKVERAHWISNKPIFRKLMEHIEIDQHHITFHLQQHTHQLATQGGKDDEASTLPPVGRLIQTFG